MLKVPGTGWISALGTFPFWGRTEVRPCAVFCAWLQQSFHITWKRSTGFASVSIETLFSSRIFRERAMLATWQSLHSSPFVNLQKLLVHMGTANSFLLLAVFLSWKNKNKNIQTTMGFLMKEIVLHMDLEYCDGPPIIMQVQKPLCKIPHSNVASY